MAKENLSPHDEIDVRASQERRDEQRAILRRIRNVAGGRIQNLFSQHGRINAGTYANEASMQYEDSRRDRGVAEEGRIRSQQLAIDPKRLKDAMRTDLDSAQMLFQMEGQDAALQTVDVNVQVNLTHAYWVNRRDLPVAAIARHIRNMTPPQLAAQMGITVGMVAPFRPGTGAFNRFTEEQATDIANRCKISQSRGTLSKGGVGEMNVRQAQHLLRQNPYMFSLLESGAGHAKAEEAENRSKADLQTMLGTLRGITSRTCDMNFQLSETEFAALELDLRPGNFSNLTRGFASTFFNARFPNPGAILPADRTAERNAGASRLTVLRDDLRYYRQVADLLRRIHAQIASVRSLRQPADPAYAILFPGGVFQPAQLNSAVNPGLVADAVVRGAGNLEPTQGHGHKEAPEGAQAVLDIFREHFKRQYDCSDDEAKRRAYQMYFRNELSAQEALQAQNEIQNILPGGRLIWTTGMINGTKSVLKGLFRGSQEAYIVRVAESMKVNIPKGVGTTTQNVWQSAADTGTLAAGALGATALLSGSALTGGLPLAVGAGVLGAKALISYGGRLRGLRRWRNVPFFGRVARGMARVGDFFNGVDRTLFGTRVLGLLWPRWHARPAWGELSKNPQKLKLVWDMLRKGVRDGELQNTWYTQEQLGEVARLLLPTIAESTGEQFMHQKMTPEQWKEFNKADKRTYLQKEIHEVISEGYTGVGIDGDKALEGKDDDDDEQRELRENVKETSETVGKKHGGWRRYLFGEGFQNWLGKKQ